MEDSNNLDPIRALSKMHGQDLTPRNGATAVRFSEHHAGKPNTEQRELPEDADGAGLLGIWYLIKRRKGRLFLFAFSGVLLALLAGFLKTPIYRATASLELLTLNDEFLNMKQVSAVSTSESSIDTSELQTQIKILESGSLRKRTMARMNPALLPEKRPAQNSGNSFFSLFQKPSLTPFGHRAALLGRAADSLKVNATGRTRIVQVSVDSTDPKLAADFANTLSNEYIDENIENRWNSTQKTSQLLSRELESTRTKLERSEDALQRYARQSGLIFTDADTNISSEKLQQVQQELSEATADRITRQSRFELAQKSSPESVPEVLNDAGLRDTAAKITDLRREVANMSATFTPEYTKLKRAQAELAILQASFDRSRADILARIGNEYQEASRKEKLLDAAYEAQTKEVTGQGEKSIQYNILKREVDSNRQLYDTMLQQLKQSSIASAMRASNVQIIDAAEIPDMPYSPNLRTNGIIGLLAGVLFGLLSITIQERGNSTVKGPGEAQSWTRLPELGIIPSASMVLGNGVYAERSLPKVANGNRSGSKYLFEVFRPKEIQLAPATQERAPSVMAEAFRSVLTSILFSSENGSLPRVIVFSSANVADGKTTVVSNLGIAAAESGRSVLIIDADLRGPRMHRLFDLPNKRGLSSLLRESSLSEVAMEGIVQETKISGLHVLTSGPQTHEAANLLYSPNLAELLVKFRKQYDMVLIDTPPMLQMPDARIAGRLADAVILVARSEQTTKEAMMAASQRFTDDSIRVIGTVLNDWDPKRSPAWNSKHYSEAYASNYKRYSTENAS